MNTKRPCHPSSSYLSQQNKKISQEKNDNPSRMSIDEEEFLKLLDEPQEEDEERVDVSGDLERDLEAAMMSADERSEQGGDDVREDEMPNLSPVTPEDVIDAKSKYKADTASPRKPGKDSSAEDSSAETETSNTDGLKRKALPEQKSPSKKTRYFETDNSERPQGWAEKMIKNRRTIYIPQKPQTVPQKQRNTSMNGQGKNNVVRNNGYHQNGNRREVMQLGDTSFMPPGWMECPGLEGRMGHFLFSKTPLGERWNHRIPLHKRFTPQQIIQKTARNEQPIGLVIDLTNSSQYYDPSEFQRHGVQHHKIRCKGHGATPTAEAVNQFWWIVSEFEQRKTGNFILVHCTHGFNRTGFMVVHYTMRWAQRDTINGIIRKFALRRPPGIYKDEYIKDLLDYYHETRSSKLMTPNVPAWKGILEVEKEDEQNGAEHAADLRVRMTTDRPITADDSFGERIHPHEERRLQCIVLELMLGAQHSIKRFPGAQPVSMSRNNIEQLEKKRYWATYKADGTRYMLLLTTFGVYAINRNFEFQRVEMRFPIKFQVDKLILNPGIPHHLTLFDGEMVIDHNKETKSYTRKYLIYDLIIHDGESWMQRPWKERFGRVQEIVNTRNAEKQKIEQKKWSFEYDYMKEPFQVEAKMFACLGQIESIVRAIPTLEHECDGFIFQAYEDKYQIGTDADLLKWKYAHMNSVDFRYRHQPDAKENGQLFLLQGSEILCKDATVVFENESDKQKFNGKIIECVYDSEHNRWKFLRERVDKKTPNAYRVYENILKSIRDNITEPELLNRILGLFSESNLYAKDREKLAACDQSHL